MDHFKIVREKLDQTEQILKDQDVDVWMTFVREVTQTNDPALELILGTGLTWVSALILTKTGERIAIIGNLDKDNVERSESYTKVIGYDKSPNELILEELKRVNPNKIALNYSGHDSSADGLTHGLYMYLMDLFKDTDFANRIISAEKVIGSLRGQKAKSEIELIKKACAFTEQVFRDFKNEIKPGISENDVAKYFQNAAFSNGHDFAWPQEYCPVVTAGPHSPFGHTIHGDYFAHNGELLQVDFGLKVNGFCSDLQRTYYLLNDGETQAPDDVVKAFEDLKESLEAGREALVPGAEGWEVDKAAREYLIATGYPDVLHAFGHQVGRIAHDGGTVLGPKWERYGDAITRKIEAGNVFAIEMDVPVKGRGIIGLEEIVLVTETGTEFLSTPQEKIWVV